MSRIFISYRRDDTAGYAIALFTKLSEHFGRDRIFMDIDTIEPGLDFVEAIEQAVGSCDALIALIGKQWLSITDETGSRRLDDTYDIVRLEIATALARNVRVIPTLVHGAPMPRADDLPDALKKLARRHALELSDRRFDHDVSLLVATLEKILTPVQSAVSRIEPPDILRILPPPFEWCEIPAGHLTLGDDAETFDAPPFLMAKYPITYGQFQVFLDAADGFSNPTWWGGLAADADHKRQPGEQRFKVESHPRENASWYDAVAFCRWLNTALKTHPPLSLRERRPRGESYELRLPTEWEWQWAAQGSDDREYPWGNDFDTSRCNTTESGTEQTTPVYRYPSGASPFGVLDMVGNVWEWCLNEYESPGKTGLGGKARRVVRGGSWNETIGSARAVVRLMNDPDDRDWDSGFRMVWALPPSV